MFTFGLSANHLCFKNKAFCLVLAVDFFHSPPLRNKAQVDSLRILKLENVNTKQGTHVCVAILSSTKICGSLTTHILCVKNLNELLGDYDSELQCDNA